MLSSCFHGQTYFQTDLLGLAMFATLKSKLDTNVTQSGALNPNLPEKQIIQTWKARTGVSMEGNFTVDNGNTAYVVKSNGGSKY
jgi:hypothetical protein